MTQFKPVAVTEKNADQIQELLDQVQAGASARLLDRHDLASALVEAEKRLTDVPKRLWAGATLRVDPHAVPNSYRGRAEGTTAVLVRRTRDWALVEAGRTPTRSASYGTTFRNQLTLASTVERADLLEALLRAKGLTLPAVAQDGPDQCEGI